MLIRLVLALLFFSCSSESYMWFNGSLDEALYLIQDSNKIILLDFIATIKPRSSFTTNRYKSLRMQDEQWGKKVNKCFGEEFCARSNVNKWVQEARAKNK